MQISATPTAPTILAPRFMARFSGLPFDAVAGLRQPRSIEWAVQLIDLRNRLEEHGRMISDELAQLVKSNEDTAFRRLLLNTRRQLFTCDRPKDGRAVAARIGGHTGAALNEWLDRHEELTVRLADPVVDQELAAAKAHLRTLGHEPRLRQALILASPTLDEHLSSYLDADPGKLSKRQRRIERSLVEYTYRCASKTSPFSSFTGVAVGEFDTHCDERYALTVDERWTDHTQLNIAVLGRIGELILQQPQLRPDLPVELVTGLSTEADRIRYVRRKVSQGDNTASASFDSVTENMFFLKQGNGLETLIRICGAEGRLPYGRLLDLFAEHLKVGQEDCDRFLSTLLRLGLLSVPALAVDIHSGDPVSSFADSVRGIGLDWSQRLAAGLDEVARLVHGYCGAPIASRRGTLEEIRERLGRLQLELGAEAVSLPRTLVYEDTRAAAVPVRLDGQQFANEVCSDLVALSRIMPIFDVAMPHRLTLRGFFLARYGLGGRCEDLLELVTDFQEDLYHYYVQVAGASVRFAPDGTFRPTENWLDQLEITAIDGALQLFSARMRTLVATEPGAAQPAEVEIDDAFVTAVAAELRPVAAGFRPESHFVQLNDTGARPTAVLNRSWGGVSFPFSRFTHDFADLGLAEQLREWHQEIQPEGAIFAEVTGGAARTNLNLHGRLTDYEIVCPGETSTTPTDRQIALADMSLRHDTASGRLVLHCARLDREIIPVYFGYLVPAALPDVARTLLLLAPSAMVAIDPWGGVPKSAETAGVTQRPRVRHGSVVISRRSWTARADALPRRLPGVSTAQWFLEWQRWRRTHGVPAQAFVTLRGAGAAEPAGSTQATDGPAAETAEGAERPMRRQKPHFLDFESALSLQLFEHLLNEEHVAAAVISEMLPGPDGLHARSQRGAHITELVVETIAGHRQAPWNHPTEES